MKIMDKIRSHRGSLTVFMTIIIFPMMIFGMSIVDFAKIILGRDNISSSAELAIDSGLTTYDKALKDVYGMLATSATEEELSKKMSDYFTATLSANGIDLNDNSKVTDFMNNLMSNGLTEIDNNNLLTMAAESVQATKISASSIANPAVLKRQIVEYMKYRAPINMATGMLDKLSVFGDMKNQTGAAEAKIDFADKMQGIQDGSQKLFDATNNYLQNLEDSKNFSATKGKEIGYMLYPMMAITGFYDNDFSVSKIKPESSVKNQINTIINNNELDDDAKAAALMNIAYSYADDAKKQLIKWKTIPQVGGTLSQLSTNFQKVHNYLSEIKLLCSDSSENSDIVVVRNFYAAINAYESYSEGVFDEEIDEIKEVVSKAKQLKNDTFNYTTNRLTELLEPFYDTYKKMQLAKEYSAQITKNVSNFKEAVNEARSSANKWSTANSAINTATVQSSMTAQHSEETSALAEIDDDEITCFDNLIISQKTSVAKWLEDFEAYSICDKKMVGELFVYDNISQTVKNTQSAFSNYIRNNINNDNTTIENSTFRNSSITNMVTYCINIPDPTVDLDSLIINVKATKTYQFLEEKCKTTTTTVNEVTKTSAEACKKDLEGQNSDNAPKPDTSNLAGKENKLINTQFFADYYNNLQNENNDTYQYSSQNTATLNKPGNSSDGAKTSLKNTGTMFNCLSDTGNLFENFRDDLYMTEYIQEMFTSYTYNKGLNSAGNFAATSNGFAKNEYNNYYAGAEIEYILYGNENMVANVVASSATIFAIRFALNLIYSFTDSEINAFTTYTSSILTAAIPFAAPLVKIALHLGLAIAESGLDLGMLLEGNSVPIFKTKDTWICKPSGLAKKMATYTLDVAKTAAKNISGEIIDSLSSTVNSKIDEIAQLGADKVTEVAAGIKQTAKQTADDIKNSAKDEIFTPLTNLVTNCVNRTSDEIRSMVTTTLAELQTSISSHEDSELKTLELKILEQLNGPMNSTLNSAIESAANLVNQAGDKSTEFLNKINGVFDNVISNLSGTITDLTSSIETKLTSAINEFAQSAKTTVNSTAESAKSSLTKTINKISFGKSTDKSGSVSLAQSFLSMNYDEYLYLFLVINLATQSEDAVLMRTAQLMEINLRYAGCTADAAGAKLPSMPDGSRTSKLIEKKEDYSINEAVTLVTASTDVKLNTYFLGAVFQENGLSLNGFSDRKFTISYKGVGGY